MRDGWRYSLLPPYFISGIEDSDAAVYQFGVYSGNSMDELSACLEFAPHITTMLGFDVFSGMPNDPGDQIFQDAWLPGNFNAMIDFNSGSPREYADSLEHKLSNTFSHIKYKIYDGLVEDTLEPNKDELPIAFYVDFDMDIYSPTLYAFDFLVRNNKIVEGTLIGYDDWGGAPHDNFQHGESRAHKEICDKYNIDAFKLSEQDNGWPHKHNVWRIESIGTR
jgi:hypothetical protein